MCVNKVHPLTNFKEISFGQLHSASELHLQLDYHKISASDIFNETKLSSLKLFSNYSPSTYFVQFNVDLSACPAHHAVAAHVKQQWTNLPLPSEIVAIITEKFTVIGKVQRVDMEEAITLNSGVEMFQQFLGSTHFTITFI